MKNWCGGKRFLGVLCFQVIFLSFQSSTLFAQTNSSSAIQQVTLEVKPISKISVSGNPSPLVIKNSSMSDEYSISDENTKYDLITNIDNMKIVASISDRMPDGTRLMVRVVNNRASSAGQVDVSNALAPVDVVTGIGKGRDVGQSICYTFSANGDVLEISRQSRTITLTLTN